MAYETANVVVKESPRRALTCLFADCNYQWMSRIEPEKCPHCVRRGWKTGIVYIGAPKGPRPPIEKVRSRRMTKKAREATPAVKVKQTPSRSPAVVAVKREKLAKNIGRAPGKCPHDYMNWLVCPTCNPR